MLTSKQPKPIPYIKWALILVAISVSSFFVGKTQQDVSEVVSDEPVVQLPYIEGRYIEEDRDFEAEASEIKSKFKPNMSTSKIKHLLIYADGMAREYDVNYNLVKSIITVESRWNYKAKSSAGALGLMQIMKVCAKDYKTPHSEMYDPYVNITIGIKYISKQLDRFDNTQYALVAYNEGPTYAKKYRQDYVYDARYVVKIQNALTEFEQQLVAGL